MPKSAPASARIVAIYRVDLGSFNLGDFRVTTTFRGDGYEMRGEGRFSILEGLVYDWRGSSASAGRVTPDGPEPSMYALNYTDGGKRGEQLRMTFDDGAVRNISIQPRTRALPGTIPVTREQLEGVLDPLSGAFLTARSANPNGDLSVCNQMLPVFDGKQRFDLVLKPKKAVRGAEPLGHRLFRTGGDLPGEVHPHRRLQGERSRDQVHGAERRDRGLADPGQENQYVCALSDRPADAGRLWDRRRHVDPGRRLEARERRLSPNREGALPRAPSVNAKAPKPNMS